jgi:hypothetical protein
MTENLFCIKHKNGSISIMTALSDDAEGEIEKWSENDRATILSWRKIKPTDLPDSREFRNAWCDVTAESCIDINHEKVRDICLDRLRGKRDEKLKELDVTFIRALEQSDAKLMAKTCAQKQGLRDATEALKNLDVSGVNDAALIGRLSALADI